jgi:hypothetical protein
MTIRALRTSLLTAALLLGARLAHAVGPLEYPDNGSASFSRGGAWLATATDPIATHYNPAALATQATSASLELNFNFNKVCYARLNPGGEATGPVQGTADDAPTRYLGACNDMSGYPRFIPSAALVYRASDTLGFGFAVLPPAAYGTAEGEWPDTSKVYSESTGRTVDGPASFRFMVAGNESTILLPTLAVGYEIFEGFRVGAGFIWGVALIDVPTFGISQVNPGDQGDHAAEDSKSRLRTDDLFLPGGILAVHWSLTENIDVAAWGRWLDSIKTSSGTLDITTTYWNNDLNAGPGPNAVDRTIEGEDVRRFEFQAIPPEVRVGIRFHLPRDPEPPKINPSTLEPEVVPPEGFAVRDPLRDDVFDVELNGSYTLNTASDRIIVRFPQDDDGTAKVRLAVGQLPPNADRITGYEDTFGFRLGGQLNVIRNKLGIRAGTWYESQAADDEWLHVAPVPAERGGFGGGVVLRQDHFDFSLGYQYHWSTPMDNGGNGALRANAGEIDGADEFRLGEGPHPFRSYHTINGGRVTQSAHAFTLGGVYRF